MSGRISSHFKEVKRGQSNALFDAKSSANKRSKPSDIHQPQAPHKDQAERPVLEKTSSPGLASSTGPAQDVFSKDEQLLREFDLSLKYGPCIGMTRMERFKRALKFGLQPPAEVGALLEKLGPDHSLNQGLWANRL